MPTRTMLCKIRCDEEGFALVTAMLLLSVMSLLMVVSLTAGNAAFNLSEQGSKWNKTLQVAETGVDDAITRLAQDRTAASACLPGGGTPCVVSGGKGEYEVKWDTPALGKTVIESTGYYPTKANAEYTRIVEVTLEPIPVFRYALFSADTMDVKNGQTVIGDIYATNGVSVDQNSIVCGSIVVAAGDITLANGSQVVKELAGSSCEDKEGLLWAGGSINLGVTSVVEGTATASGPSGFSCSSSGTSYQITGGTIEGNAKACGRITSTITPPATSSPGTASDAPAVEELPEFVFDPGNYQNLNCPISTVADCSPDNPSASAVSQFAGVSRTGMAGAYAIWQDNPSQATKVDLANLTLSGDTTIITNAPIDFGNASSPPITTTDPDGSLLVIISLYPAPGSCTENGGDCSIYGKNSVEFDDGDDADPDDGVAGLLFTTGKMAFKNSANAAEGALYAGTMDIKNGFDIVYNSRVERILGFGSALQQTLWRECQNTGC